MSELSKTWVDELLEELIEESRDYRDKALLKEVQQVLTLQDQRIELLEGQLDGSLWSPKNW